MINSSLNKIGRAVAIGLPGVVLLLVVAFFLPASARGADDTTRTISDISTNLGTQVHRITLMRSDLGRDGDGRPVLYTVLMGNPAILCVVDLNTAKVTSTHPLPGTSGAWGVKVSADNTAYLGCYNSGLLYRYDPATGELTNHGPPLPTKPAVIYPMTTDTTGTIYGGTYPSSHLYSFDPASEKLTDHGSITKNTNPECWLRVTVFDPKTNNLYIGVGNQAELVEYDLDTHTYRNILPPQFSNITSVYDLNVEGDRLFCRKEVNNPNEYFVLDQHTHDVIPVTNADTGETSTVFQNSSRGLSPLSPVANKMYYIDAATELCEYNLDTNTVRRVGARIGGVATGYGYAELDDPEMPGPNLVGTAGMRGTVFKYNLQTGKLKLETADLPPQPLNIHDIELGPDGLIYTGGYLGGNAGVLNPVTGEHRDLVGISQSEGITSVHNKLYFGLYPSARIYEYDLAKPWDTSAAGDMKNPVQIFALTDNKQIPGYTNQDRTFAMAGAPDLNKLLIGTVPKNNQLGGVLAIYDVETRGEPEVHWNIVKDQSIITLVYHDGIVYGGTSIYGGLGADHQAREVVLFAWDIKAKKKLFEIVPASGQRAITALHLGPDNNIWGFANGTLFIFDPKTREVIHTSQEYTDVHDQWIGGSMLTHPNGNIYGTVGGRLFKIDPATREVTTIAKGARKAAIDREGNLYTYGSPRTYLFKIPAKDLNKY